MEGISEIVRGLIDSQTRMMSAKDGRLRTRTTEPAAGGEGVAIVKEQWGHEEDTTYPISIGRGFKSMYKRSPTKYANVTRRFFDTTRLAICDCYLELDSPIGTCDHGLSVTWTLDSLLVTRLELLLWSLA